MATLSKTIKLKIYPDDYGWLNAAACEVNQIFNYCNEVSARQHSYWKAGETHRKRLSGIDLCNLTSGYTEFCEYIGADTIQCVAMHHAERSAAGKARLNWRVSKAGTVLSSAVFARQNTGGSC
jgi:hypothetical protein